MIKKLKKVFQPLPIAILSFSVSLSAGTFALQASENTAHEAKVRATQVQQVSAAQNAKLQGAFCNLLVPLTKVKSTTPEGQAYVDHAKSSVQILECPQ